MRSRTSLGVTLIVIARCDPLIGVMVGDVSQVADLEQLPLSRAASRLSGRCRQR
jgi:hypothetical protein